MPHDDEQRDAHLSLRWESRNGWEPISDALGHRGFNETLAAVALALWVEATGSGRWVSYSRRRAHYALPKRYRSRLYTYDRVVGVVDLLDGIGLIENLKAPPGTRGRQSIMRATGALVDLIGDTLDSRVTVHTPRETLILRDDVKNPVDYRDNRETDRIRRQVEAQNEAIMGVEIGGGNVLQLRTPLRRIFNGDFVHGGRAYAEGGGWQTLRKEERLRLWIDGERVVEIDYAQFHPTVAYAQIGLPPPEEAYAFPGFDRGLVKIAFNVMLNSSSRNGARYSIAHKPGMVRHILGDDIPDDLRGEEMWRWAEGRCPGYVQTATREAERLIDHLMDLHRPIARMFFTGAGLRFQRLDSDIAEAVMKRMRKQGIVVLPVHDSFLAPFSKAGLLEEVMRDEAAKFRVMAFCKSSSIVPYG